VILYKTPESGYWTKSISWSEKLFPEVNNCVFLCSYTQKLSGWSQEYQNWNRRSTTWTTSLWCTLWPKTEAPRLSIDKKTSVLSLFSTTISSDPPKCVIFHCTWIIEIFKKITWLWYNEQCINHLALTPKDKFYILY